MDLSDKEWGIVLAGGGGKGSYQIGVMRALEEMGIMDYVTAISGSSVGALNAILYAYAEVKLAMDVWEEISPRQFLGISPEMIDLKEGLVKRDGLNDIFDKYIDFDRIRMNEKTVYANVTDYGPDGKSAPKSRYLRLNYRPVEEIRDILLASSALPIIYEPIRIDGKVCRDGGLTDNLPIAPLYIEGIRNFIVVGLSKNTDIPYEKYADAEFILIKPKQDIGEFWDGTLDFTSEGAKVRMEIGYIDAIRELDKSTYDKIKFDEKYRYLESTIQKEIDQINNLMNKYTGE